MTLTHKLYYVQWSIKFVKDEHHSVNSSVSKSLSLSLYKFMNVFITSWSTKYSTWLSFTVYYLPYRDSIVQSTKDWVLLHVNSCWITSYILDSIIVCCFVTINSRWVGLVVWLLFIVYNEIYIENGFKSVVL